MVGDDALPGGVPGDLRQVELAEIEEGARWRLMAPLALAGCEVECGWKMTSRKRHCCLGCTCVDVVSKIVFSGVSYGCVCAFF